jgi:protein O-mannosyl-transferase
VAASHSPTVTREDRSGEAPFAMKIFLCLLLAVATFVVFARVRGHDFVNYDDGTYVTRNPEVRAGLTRRSVAWAFTATEAGNWHPLTWLSLQLDAQLYGLKPAGFHVTNLLLHVASTLLLFLVFTRMTQAPWRSACVAAFFAVHPVHVESVAWIAERKDVLSTLLWMVTLWSYVGYVQKPGSWRYVSVIAAFALGLLAKPMLVTLPFVLLLLDYWPLFRNQRSEVRRQKSAAIPISDLRPLTSDRAWGWLVLEKTPLFVLSLVSCLVTWFAQHERGATAWTALIPWHIRLENALLSYAGYTGKMLWPHNLAVFYPYPSLDGLLARALTAAALLGTLTILVLLCRRSLPYLAVGWFWYLGTLIPVIGLVQVGMQAMADRYTYIPLIGLFLAMVWGVADLAAHWHVPRVVIAAASGAVLIPCLVLTWIQVGYWRDSLTLWQHAVQVTRNNYLAHYNLGVALEDLGLTLKDQGKLEEAARHYSESLAINPTNPNVASALGLNLLRRGEPEQALAYFSMAREEAPDSPQPHYHAGLALMGLGRYEEAGRSFTAAAQLDSGNAEILAHLGSARALQSQWAEAVSAYHQAVTLQPDEARYWFDLGYVLQEQGQSQPARRCYQRALRLDPTLPQHAFQEAWMLATDPNARYRNGVLALRLAKQACQATGFRQPQCLDALAAAYAETGRFDEAQAAARQALELLKTAPADRTRRLEARLQLYREHKPFRMVSGEQ